MVSRILEQLIKNDPSLIKKDGTINQAAAAKVFGIHQPTLFRILSGKSAEPKAHAVQAICGYFGIQPAQLRGEAPLELIPSLISNVPLSIRLTKSETLILSLYRALSPSEQKTATRIMAALKG
jgi:transcriptional regulator with XRE-family HTH domain